MNHNHPKEVRLRRSEAKKTLKEVHRIIKKMEQYLDSSSAHAVEMGASFLHIMKYHIEEGDLMPDNINLAALLRGCGIEKPE